MPDENSANVLIIINITHLNPRICAIIIVAGYVQIRLFTPCSPAGSKK